MAHSGVGSKLKPISDIKYIIWGVHRFGNFGRIKEALVLLLFSFQYNYSAIISKILDAKRKLR